MIDSVGAHRGMHYYNFALVSAMNDAGANVTLISTDETEENYLLPKNVPLKIGFKGIYGHSKKWIRGARYLFSLLRIAKWVWEYHPDIVHFHFFQMPRLDSLFLQYVRYLNITIISTVHDVLTFDLIEKEITSRQALIYRNLYRKSDGLIVQSKYAKEMLMKLDDSLQDKTILLPQGNYTSVVERTRLGVINPRKMLDLQQEEVYILVFGSIKPNKRLDLVIQAFQVVLGVIPRAKLIVLGKPWQLDVTSFQKMARDLNIADRVIWRLEYVDDEELFNYIAAVDVIVFPYQWIYSSAALLMAMSFGKPIIATAVGSNLEQVNDNNTGLLIPLDDVATLADAMIRILNNRDFANELGQNATKYVVTELSWSKIARGVLAFYDQVFGEQDCAQDQSS